MGNRTKDVFLEAINTDKFKMMLIAKVRPMKGASDAQQEATARDSIQKFLKKSGAESVAFMGISKKENLMMSVYVLATGSGLNIDRIHQSKSNWPGGEIQVMSIETTTSKSMATNAVKSIQLGEHDDALSILQNVTFGPKYLDGVRQPDSLSVNL